MASGSRDVSGGRSNESTSSWNRVWSCLSQPFRRRRRELQNGVDERSWSRSRRDGLRYDVVRFGSEASREQTTRETRRNTFVETRGEARKRYKAPSPETFYKLREAIKQVEESNEMKHKSNNTMSEDGIYQEIQDPCFEESGHAVIEQLEQV